LKGICVITCLRLKNQQPGRWAAVKKTALAGLMALGAALPGLAQAQQRLQIVGGLANVNQFKLHEEPFWTKELPQLTKGQLTAEIVPWDRAGIPSADLLRMMKAGVVPFGTMLLSNAQPQDMALSAPDLAGLNPDIASLRRNVKTFRPYMEKLLREQYGIELLAVYTYPGQATFCNKPVTGLDDLTGRRVRTSSPSQSDLVESLGAIPVRTAFAEILSNVKSGNIDCVITGTMSGNTIGLHQATTHLHAMTVNWGLSLFAASQTAWKELPQASRDVLKRELARLERDVWDDAERETGMGLQCNAGAADCTGGVKGNMVIVRGTPADEKRRKEIFANTVLNRWLQRCGNACATAWNQTLGPSLGINAAVR
jgi:TRAP-type C4-dicarboxylate transport system substrate-binding protein